MKSHYTILYSETSEERLLPLAQHTHTNTHTHSSHCYYNKRFGVMAPCMCVCVCGQEAALGGIHN